MRHNIHGRCVLRGACLLLLCILICPGWTCQAQETHTLTHWTSNSEVGSAEALAYGNDGTIFLLGERGGLWAFRRDAEEFDLLAYYPVQDGYSRLAIGPHNDVYLAGTWKGLAAFSYRDQTFEKIASGTLEGEANGLCIGPDGTVMLAAGHAGLIAMRRFGDRLLRVAQTSEGGYALSVAAGDDGSVYLGCENEAILSAYHFDGSAFIRVAKTILGAVRPVDISIDRNGTIFLGDRKGGVTAYTMKQHEINVAGSINDGGTTMSVAAGPDIFVYLANADDGMRAYAFDGDSFHRAGHWQGRIDDARCVAVDEDGIVLLANGRDGLRAICCDGIRNESVAHYKMGGEARSVAVGPDGTVFLANGEDGLRAYRVSKPFVQTAAWTNEKPESAVHARAVAVDWFGRVILAHDRALSIYTYTGRSFIRIAHVATVGDVNSIAVSTDGWIYLASGYDGLEILRFDGQILRTVMHVNDGGYANDVSVADDGSVFLATGDDGLRGYIWYGQEFLCTAHLNNPGNWGSWARGVAAGPGNTVFLANGQDGLHAYSFTGSTFTPLAHLEMPAGGYVVGMNALDVGPGNTVFFGFDDYAGTERSGLYACEFDGSGFRVTAHVTDIDRTMDIAAARDGKVYLADGGGGLQGYQYAVTKLGPHPVADRDKIDFGYLEIGDENVQSVTISNLGNAPLTIREQYIAEYGKHAFSIAHALPIRVEVGESAYIDIVCHPVTTGPQQATLIIDTYDIDNMELHIPLKAFVMGDVADAPVPVNLTLEQNVPNPFNPSTTIRFRIPTDTHVRLTVFNLTGQYIATLVDAPLPSGWHDIHFDATALASGMYLYRLETAAGIETRRMILTK